MVKAVVFDVDGTLTDGKIYMGNNGEVFKAFDIKDGCAIHDIMPKHQIIPIIITARTSYIVKNRCKELGIEKLYQGCRNKKEQLQKVAEELGFACNSKGIYEEMAYIGDDIIDIPSMEIVGIKGCPADAVQEVKAISDFISSKNGGEGAVREFIEWLIRRL